MEENNENIRFLSAISYIPLLFIIGHFALEKNNPDLRFHKFQGFVLSSAFIIMYLADLLIYLLLSGLPVLQTVITLLLSVGLSVGYIMLIVMGITSALKFEQKILPFVGNAAVLLREKLDEKFRSN